MENLEGQLLTLLGKAVCTQKSDEHDRKIFVFIEKCRMHILNGYAFQADFTQNDNCLLTMAIKGK